MGPRQCALATAVPLGLTSFARDWWRAHPRDLPRQVAAAGAGMLEAWRAFAPVARRTRRTCRLLRRLGVAVRPDATFRDVRALAQRYSVVVLLTHWAYRSLGEGDLVDPEGLAAWLRAYRPEQERPSAEAVFRTAFEEEWRQFLARDGGERAGAGRALVRCMNALIERDRGKYEPLAAPVAHPAPERDGGTLVRFPRFHFELAFPEYVRADRSIDMGDGARDVHGLVASVPPDFAGVLDLTMCHAALVGEAIKRPRPGRPSCLVVVNDRPLDLEFSLLLLELTVRHLSARSMPYVDATIRAREQVAGALRNTLATK